jgi:hypothetical protein
MSGTVEILQSAENRDAAGQMEHSFTIDIDESLTLDCSNMGMFPPPGANLVNGRLHIDRNKVCTNGLFQAGQCVCEGLVEGMVDGIWVA